MATTPRQRARVIRPPFQEAPLQADGQYTSVWTGYHQQIADYLGGLGLGAVDGSDSVAGEAGEYLSISSTAVPLVSGAATNLVVLPLPAGDWEIAGNVVTQPAGSTNTTMVVAGISNVSLSLVGAEGSLVQHTAVPPTGAPQILPVGVRRLNTSSDGNALLVVQIIFNSGGLLARGFLGARRVR